MVNEIELHFQTTNLNVYMFKFLKLKSALTLPLTFPISQKPPLVALSSSPHLTLSSSYQQMKIYVAKSKSYVPKNYEALTAL